MASQRAQYEGTDGTAGGTAGAAPESPDAATEPSEATGGSRNGDAKSSDPKAVDPKSPDPQSLDPKIAAAIAAAEAAGPQGASTVRVDSWIWSVRLVKTRSMGATACRGGHVRVNGERVKPAHGVRVGDEVRLRHEGRERVVVVTRLIRKRVGPPVATQCYIDNSPPPPPREAVAPAGIRDRGAGRPTKRDRREMERLRGVTGPGSVSGPGPVPGKGFGSAPGKPRP
ncbi:RNA-binding S4 domain-containing protein [Streptomyces massasporeus]